MNVKGVNITLHLVHLLLKLKVCGKRDVKVSIRARRPITVLGGKDVCTIKT